MAIKRVLRKAVTKAVTLGAAFVLFSFPAFAQNECAAINSGYQPVTPLQTRDVNDIFHQTLCVNPTDGKMYPSAWFIASTGTIGGSGTANRVAKFTASGTIGNANPVDNGITYLVTEPICRAAVISGTCWFAGSGSPESVVSADIGSLYSRSDGSQSTAIYIKGSSAGSPTGWLPIGIVTSVYGRTGAIVAVSGDAGLYFGTGSPEGAVTAPVGSVYRQTDGVAGTTLWTKITGAGSTGWGIVPEAPVGGLTATALPKASVTGTGALVNSNVLDSSTLTTLNNLSTTFTNRVSSYGGTAITGNGFSPGLVPVYDSFVGIDKTTTTAEGFFPVPGAYEIVLFLQSSATCATLGPASVTATIHFFRPTETIATIPLNGLGVVNGTDLGLGNTDNYGEGRFMFWAETAPNPIEIDFTFVACTTGTAKYTYAVSALNVSVLP
jgi:hypothetical protein